MTDVKEKAIELINELSDDKIVYIIQILQSLKGLHGQADSVMSNELDKEKAFETLEKLRKKIPELDYDKELAEGREAAVTLAAMKEADEIAKSGQGFDDVEDMLMELKS